MIRTSFLISVISIVVSACLNPSDQPQVGGIPYAGSGSITRGLGTVTTANLLSGCAGSRTAAVGTITSADGKVWTVPADTQFTTGTKASDLYNDCSGVRLADISQLDLSTVPTAIIDTDGTVITAYIFSDNYFELYINGTLVGVDPVPYTPYNSSVLQFKVKRPYTIAMKLVDWEENLGVASEVNGTNAFYSGAGGLIAYFSDGTKTDATWKAQTYYIAPLADVTAVSEGADGTRTSSNATTQPACAGSCFGLHWLIPADWATSAYGDAAWPAATLYATAAVGVDSKPAYTNFSSVWSTASFIWTNNLVLDNVVLVRKKVQ